MGRECLRRHHGKYGTIDYQDLMAFTDEVLRRYPAIDQAAWGYRRVLRWFHDQLDYRPYHAFAPLLSAQHF